MKPFGLAFASAGSLGVASFFGSALVPEEHHGCMMLCIAVFLWTICLSVAAVRKPLATQIGVATGFSWGFLVAATVGISLNNGRVSVNWSNMLPGLVVIPAAVQLTVLPVYLVSKMVYNRRPA